MLQVETQAHSSTQLNLAGSAPIHALSWAVGTQNGPQALEPGILVHGLHQRLEASDGGNGQAGLFLDLAAEGLC